jgi:nucleoid-associated protein YgaU
MDCPVCKTTGLGENTPTCPQCKTDLSAISLVKEAQRAYSSQKRQKTLWIFLAVFMAFAFIVSMLLPSISGKYVSRSEYTALSDQLGSTQNDLTKISFEAEKLKQEMDAARTAQDEIRCREITYTVQWGQNLSRIASAVYGDGHQYSKIASDNALQDPDHILDGQKLIIRY